MERENFGLMEQYFCMTMKGQHTIVEKWPVRLKLKPNQPGCTEGI